MKFSLFTKYGALNSPPVFSAFEESLKKYNHSVVLNDLTADVAVIWSVLWKGRMQPNKEVWNYYRSNNKPVIVLEVGNFIRNTTWKIGLNGINRNNYCYPETFDNSRPNKFNLNLKEWNSNGEFILICLQQSESLQWKTQPATDVWLHNTIEKIQSVSKRPILVRPHPRSKISNIERNFKNVYRQDPKRLENTYDSFDLKFDNIYATVNWNSNPGVNSVINGIQSIVGPDSLAVDVAETELSNIENLKFPNRLDWLIKISHTEFTLDEIAKGIPLQNLTKKLTPVINKR